MYNATFKGNDSFISPARLFASGRIPNPMQISRTWLKSVTGSTAARRCTGAKGYNTTGQDRTGQDRTGQDRIGQERTGQDRTGQDRTGQDRDRTSGENFMSATTLVEYQRRRSQNPGIISLVSKIPNPRTVYPLRSLTENQNTP